MPIQLPSKSQTALLHSLGKYGEAISQDWIGQMLDGIQSILNPDDSSGVTKGDTPTTLVSRLNTALQQYGTPAAIADSLNLDFKIRVATDVAQGANHYVAANADQAEVDEFPAFELLRVYDRDVPRGFARGPKGTLIEVPDDDWPSRFKDAIADSDDSDEDKDAMRSILESTGRMIALKDSDVWNQLGNNRDDTLGNPFPPFAFNSGYDWDGVPRNECEELGLLDPGEPAEPADVDLEKLFSLP